MEIEKKYLVPSLPEDYSSYPFHLIEQAYLNRSPVIRIRKEDDRCYLTYKSSGHMVREEYNLPLNESSYLHLLEKADGHIITKKRYLIPMNDSSGLTIELDIFEGIFKGLVLAEVEFRSEEEAISFIPPAWFGEDVTFSSKYHNSTLSASRLPVD